ncbi:chemotaxis protein CheW [Dethiothermospora halolimnae]|uniref:chemotaxis protein CheW n=1 Tax=Dethiothermospora halolimnae TaxID=3114390 RepID=UPI003CCBDA54
MDMTNRISENKYVIFSLSGEYYGIDIKNVDVIEKVTKFTRVPNAAEYVKGVINLRGEVVPVVDLAKRFGIKTKDIDSESRIIIVSISDMQVGMIVDSSSEVIQLEKTDIDNPPDIGEKVSEDFIKGIGKKDGRLIILLNLKKVLKIENIDEES